MKLHETQLDDMIVHDGTSSYIISWNAFGKQELKHQQVASWEDWFVLVTHLQNLEKMLVCAFRVQTPQDSQES